MSNFLEFAGTHPIVTVLLVLIVASIPSSIIRALKGQRPIHLNFKNKHDN